MRSYERETSRSATNSELKFVFDRWCLHTRQFWRPELGRDDYYAEFLEAYGYARIGLDENPIELALSRAKSVALPDVEGFTDERIRLLAALCREIQQITGANPFFLPTRKLGEILDVHHTQAAHWLRALVVLKIINLAPGEVRRRGGNRCPRYHYGTCVRKTDALVVTLPLIPSASTFLMNSTKSNHTQVKLTAAQTKPPGMTWGQCLAESTAVFNATLVSGADKLEKGTDDD